MNPIAGLPDQVANLLLGLLVVVVAAAGTLWAAAHGVAWIVRADPPPPDLVAGTRVLVTGPADPSAAWGTDLPAVPYWGIVALAVAAVAVVG